VAELKTVGFIGLGTMGAPMARNLLAAGYRLVVHDVRPEAGDALVAAGAERADEPRRLAAVSDLVLVALPGPEQVTAVADGPAGLLAGARPGTYVIDVSTSTPECVRTLAARAAPHGVRVVDAPLSGGVRGARKGTLTIMVGGSEEDFAACRPVLDVLGEHVIHVGPTGSGHVTKLVNNLMGISNAIASMEAVAMGVAAGVDATKLLQVVNLGTGASHMTRTLYPFLILNRNFEPVRFSTELAIKDVRLALGLADEVGLPVTVGRAVYRALVEAATEHGLREADMSTYITVLERATGVEVSDARQRARSRAGDSASGSDR
jgi:3-hydroxyisobutyrate dehydrogenase-like beta-hydroxyacid dehydrogenase